ncbi:MAG: BREX-1 system adenine-specific DNA-methyltransferase PglX, partial [Veillonella parvula]
GDIADSKQGIATADNNRFLRMWYEVDLNRIAFNISSAEAALDSQKKWFPYNKGGEFRKWYGNNDYVVNWENDGFEIKHFTDDKGKLRSRPQNLEYIFKPSSTWSLISTGAPSFRFKPKGYIFDVAGMSVFSDQYLYYLLGLCNSKVVEPILEIIAPTINYQCGDIANIPVIFVEDNKSNVETLVKNNIEITKSDWDAFEISWEFNRSPLVANVHERNNGETISRISDCYNTWMETTKKNRDVLKANEEKLNEIFLEMYNLQDEIEATVKEELISIYRPDATKDIKALISYAVGCILGRYSLDIEGIVYAGGTWDTSRYQTFKADKDNIIPICDDDYFDDDLTGLFVKFVETVYGKDTLEENLQFIADALDGNGASREIIRNYFLKDFFADHCKMYQKRPIYWLFDSGKNNGFKALVYMHRYEPDLLARMRTDYVHEQQSRYRTAIEDIGNRLNNATGSERVQLSKKLGNLTKQSDEIHAYEEKIHHLADQYIAIDLDDGVKVNYAKFQDVLAKIK